MDTQEKNGWKFGSALSMNFDALSINGDLIELDRRLAAADEQDVHEEPLDVEKDAGKSDSPQPPSYEDATGLSLRLHAQPSRPRTMDPIDEDSSSRSSGRKKPQGHKQNQYQKLNSGRTQVRPSAARNGNLIINLPLYDGHGKPVKIELDHSNRVVNVSGHAQVRTAKDVRLEKLIPEPTIEITEQHIHLLSEYVGRKWPVLAKKIGLQNGQIENITSDGSLKSCKERTRLMLETWHQKYGKRATIDFIIKSLKELREYKTAKELAKIN